MQNFDVQFNLLLVNKALFVVLAMCLALLQRGETLSFVVNVLCRICTFVSNVGKSCQHVDKHFSSLLKHFVEHCQRFYNGLNNITNALSIFFNLEKRNYENRIISQLHNDEEELLSDFKKVNKEIEHHFSQFYKTNFDSSKEKEISGKFQSFVENLDLAYLVEQESLEVEAEINIDEVRNALNSFQNNNTPGDDGFTKEFYEVLFDLIGAALLDSLNAGFENGTLYISQRRGVISLIPKDENNLMTLSNWRPVTLLNVDYKILAKYQIVE